MKSRRLRRAGLVACMEERRDAYTVLVGKPEGRGRFEDPSVGGGGENNIKMNLQEVRREVELN
jgi:hypothetical protein